MSRFVLHISWLRNTRTHTHAHVRGLHSDKELYIEGTERERGEDEEEGEGKPEIVAQHKNIFTSHAPCRGGISPARQRGLMPFFGGGRGGPANKRGDI